MLERRLSMSIEITGEHLRTAWQTPVRVMDPETSPEYVVVSAEVYDQLQARAAEEDFNVRDAYPLMDAIAAKEGWDDPEMAEYDGYPEPKS
jgi:hypothetical protein